MSSHGCTLTFEVEAHQLRCTLSGDLTGEIVPILEAAARKWLEAHIGTLTMDLLDASTFSTDSIRLLLRLHDAATTRGSEAVFLLSPNQRKHLRLLGFEKTFADIHGQTDAKSPLVAPLESPYTSADLYLTERKI
jgi:anti-anti-sigma regulatory factor